MTTKTPTVPTGLDNGGRKLWRDVLGLHPDLDAVQLVQLHEACRLKDRCDKFDRLLRGTDKEWLRIEPNDDGALVVIVTSVVDKANSTANLMKQMLAAMRLPDRATGKVPQARGGARGSYTPGGKGGGKVSSLFAAQRASGG